MSAHLSCTGGVRACVCRGARCPLYPHTSSIRCCASTAWAESYPAHHTEAWRTRVSPASETPADTYSEPRQLRETRARVCYTEIWTDQCVCVCVCVCVCLSHLIQESSSPPHPCPPAVAGSSSAAASSSASVWKLFTERRDLDDVTYSECLWYTEAYSLYIVYSLL